MKEINNLKERFVIHKLSKDEQVISFDCGDNDLNDFVINDAPKYLSSKLAVTYVLIDRDNSDQVVAFCSLANDRISMSDFDNRTEFNKFRRGQHFPQSKRLKSYPGVKICRLGVDRNLRGHNIGTFMLDFIKIFFTDDNKTGCRFLTVDAYLDAIPFYEKNGFSPLNSDDEKSDYTRLLFFDLNDI